MSTVTVNIDHIPTETVTDQKWADIATTLLHSHEHAIHTRTADVASLLMDNWRLSKDLKQALEDMSTRWENSDHLAAKYHRRMREAMELRNLAAAELERVRAELNSVTREAPTA